MTIYVDGILFLNFFFDFLLLLTTNIILKRNAKIFRIVLGAFIGSLSILILFFKISSVELFFIKIYLSILMIIISFGYKNIKYFFTNISTLYIVSILLGGFLYYLNIELSYKHKGLIFYHKNNNINIIFLFIISPIVLYIYIKQIKKYKHKLSHQYKVNLYIGRNILKLDGYLDTGNVLTYKGRPVIITNINNTFKNKKYYIPYTSLNGTNILECIKIRKAEVIGVGTFENIYLGFSKDININGVDVLLNGNMEG